MNIATLLFGAARHLPERPAISAADRTLTYRAFAGRVARIAGALRDGHGLLPGDRVALCMDNCPEFLEVLFACWTAGLCAVPVNAKLHPKEVAYIVDSAGARVCFTTPGLMPKLGALAEEVAGLDALICAQDERYERLLAGAPIVAHPAQPTDRAWIFYTSGTTGRPKGAVLSHRNLLFMSHCYYADIDTLDETDTMLHMAPLSHGSGLYSLPHLFKGGHQVILSGVDPGTIFAAIAEHRNVSFFAAPTMVARLVNSAEARHAELDNLKTVVYGGGPMYVADLKRALQLFGPRLYQLYGQGEAPMTITGLSKSRHAGRDDPRYEELLASCGIPRTGVAVKIVDDEDRELPAGEVGEIVTRSDCVMSEYWRNPQASADTLRNGWLHTGDLGSMDEFGFLTLRDRAKDMIISGGMNIYPREIEEVLLLHPDVEECCVTSRPHPEWGEEVVAFVVARDGTKIDPETLDGLCLENIARFKRPRQYRFIESLPKNSYGKILKAHLRRRLEEETTEGHCDA